MVISSWKQIAKYLNCGVRTAQRWARSNGLPVHRRVQPNKRGPVLALSEDLDAWVQKGRKASVDASALLVRHQQIVAALRQNLVEQKRLLEILFKERR